MIVQLIQGPEGSPNFCFALYAVKGWKELEFVQSDWDYASLASRLGWIPCKCGATDGTVICPHKTVDQMLTSAFDFLSERDGKKFRLGD